MRQSPANPDSVRLASSSRGTRRRTSSARRGDAAAGDPPRGLPGIAIFFLLSLLPQIAFNVGSLLLKPYRIVLLVLFFPLLIRLCSGKAGRMIAVDWLMIGATLWAALALMMNHPIGETIETNGIFILQFLGAYLIGRVCIRSADDFRRVVKAMFIMVAFLLPFAAVESVTRQPILLQLLGQSNVAVDAGIRFNLRRAQAIFDHPILYGTFVSTGLGLVWYALMPDGGKVIRRVFAAMVIGLSTFFSLSTGALIALVMQTGFIAWELMTAPNPRRWRIFGWGCVVTYIVLDLIATRSPFHTLVHYASFSTGSAYNRILIWRYGTDNVAANPIFGLGMNDWERPSWMGASIDNFWLLMAMRYGLPCFLMFAGALYLILRRGSAQKMTDRIDRACRAGYFTSFGGVVIAGGTVHFWNTMLAFVLFFFASGVWMITGGAREGADADQPETGRRAGSRRSPRAAANAAAGSAPKRPAPRS